MVVRQVVAHTVADLRADVVHNAVVDGVARDGVNNLVEGGGAVGQRIRDAGIHIRAVLDVVTAQAVVDLAADVVRDAVVDGSRHHRLGHIMVVRQVVAHTVADARLVLDVVIRGVVRLVPVTLHVRDTGDGVRGQVVGNHVRVHAVGVARLQRVGHRVQRHLVRGDGRAALIDNGRHPGVAPLDVRPAAIDRRAVADQQRDQAVHVARHGMGLLIDHRAVLAVGEAHRDGQVRVHHQVVVGAAHHRLVADLVVLREHRHRAA